MVIAAFGALAGFYCGGIGTFCWAFNSGKLLMKEGEELDSARRLVMLMLGISALVGATLASLVYSMKQRPNRN